MVPEGDGIIVHPAYCITSVTLQHSLFIFWQIFIGGSGNKLSGIRKDRHEGQDVSAYTPDFVTGNELRGFWITYVNGNIALGREFEVDIYE